MLNFIVKDEKRDKMIQEMFCLRRCSRRQNSMDRTSGEGIGTSEERYEGKSGESGKSFGGINGSDDRRRLCVNVAR
jgi:hypothetical protein